MDPEPIFILQNTFLIATSLHNVGFFVVSTIALLALLFLSAYISGAEVAFFSLSPADKLKLKTSINPAEVKIYQLLENPQKLLATILILNNLSNVAFVTLSTYMTWVITGSKETGGWVMFILTVFLTFVIVFIGEVTPKVYANKKSMEVAKATVNFLGTSISLLRPFSAVLLMISDVVEKRVQKKGYTLSVDEMNKAIEIAADNETTEEEKDILKGIINFSSISAKQIMTIRPDIVGVDINMEFKHLLDFITQQGYSRLPVYNNSVDKIEGILHIKDILPYIDWHEFDWKNVIRDAYFIPENKKIDILLKDFQEKHVHLAIVADEYGGTSGLITLEDIIEEIVGEINDEFDDAVDFGVEEVAENIFVMEGKTSINNLCKVLEVEANTFDSVKQDSESLGGMLLEMNGSMPKTGDELYFENFIFEIVLADKKRIKKVKVEHKLDEDAVEE